MNELLNEVHRIICFRCFTIHKSRRMKLTMENGML